MERVESILGLKISSDDIKNHINILSDEDVNLLIESLDFINKPVTVKKTIRRAVFNYNGIEKTIPRNVYSIWVGLRNLLKGDNSNSAAASYISYANENSNAKDDLELEGYKELPTELKEKFGFIKPSINVNSQTYNDYNSTSYNNRVLPIFDEDIEYYIDKLYDNVNKINKIGELFFRFRLEDKKISKYSPENTLIINASQFYEILDQTIFPVDFDNIETNWITPFVGVRISKYSSNSEYMVYYGYEITSADSEEEARNFFMKKGKSKIVLSKYFKDEGSEYLNFWVFFKIVYEKIREFNQNVEIVSLFDFDIKNFLQNTLDVELRNISKLAIDYMTS